MWFSVECGNPVVSSPISAITCIMEYVSINPVALRKAKIVHNFVLSAIGLSKEAHFTSDIIWHVTL